jgi:hypothetical protein
LAQRIVLIVKLHVVFPFKEYKTTTGEAIREATQIPS